MSKLKELEKRLRDEPDNLGLRIMVAGALLEVGRRDDAVWLYRSVAIAYREQGRTQQAITVCRRTLEFAPDDPSCRELLATLLASQPGVLASPSPGRIPTPPRESTPSRLPRPPTSPPQLSRADLPRSLQEELENYPEIASIADAARQISDSLIAANRQDDDGRPSPMVPVGWVPSLDLGDGDGDDDPTLSLANGIPRARIVDDEKTAPRELPARGIPLSAVPTTVTGPLASAFFAPVPPHHRAVVLQRFRRRTVAAGTTVIHRGEIGYGFVIVVRGRLDLHADRVDGARIPLGAIAPGEYVGEIGLLARAPGSAHVVAAVDSEILVLAASDFYEVAGAYPALSAELRKVAERRTRDYEQRLKG